MDAADRLRQHLQVARDARKRDGERLRELRAEVDRTARIAAAAALDLSREGEDVRRLDHPVVRAALWVTGRLESTEAREILEREQALARAMEAGIAHDDAARALLDAEASAPDAALLASLEGLEPHEAWRVGLSRDGTRQLRDLIHLSRAQRARLRLVPLLEDLAAALHDGTPSATLISRALSHQRDAKTLTSLGLHPLSPLIAHLEDLRAGTPNPTGALHARRRLAILQEAVEAAGPEDLLAGLLALASDPGLTKGP
ncbi:MAG: hypothetical protein H6734_24210 [Alphaproteobacteria bacterium]|nr:hypothetical protein [Alphaproteobacteria bacterium]